jgi:hypothetical protein
MQMGYLVYKTQTFFFIKNLNIMKKQLYLFGLFLFPFFIQAQNVGIGTTTPVTKLTVVTAIGTTPSIPGATSNGIFRIGIGTADGVDFGKMGSPPFSGWMQAGFNAVATDPLSIQPLGGNVGIGIISPSYLFQVNENVSANGYMNITNTATGSSGTDGLLMGLTGNSATLTNLENGSLQLGTNNLTRVMIDATGNVGIGLLAPGEKLDVSGNFKLSGEINRTATGNANLVPIAWGNIESTGAINVNSSTSNFTVTRTSIGTYNIVISGETYHFQSYSTIVTPIDAAPRLVTTGSGGGALKVNVFNITGSDVDGAFSFITYKK